MVVVVVGGGVMQQLEYLSSPARIRKPSHRHSLPSPVSRIHRHRNRLWLSPASTLARLRPAATRTTIPRRASFLSPCSLILIHRAANGRTAPYHHHTNACASYPLVYHTEGLFLFCVVLWSPPGIGTPARDWAMEGW